MTQFVNTENFFQWYRSVAKAPVKEEQSVLDAVFQQFCQSREQKFSLTETQTKSGTVEQYPFQFQHINCCGADYAIISF